MKFWKIAQLFLFQFLSCEENLRKQENLFSRNSRPNPSACSKYSWTCIKVFEVGQTVVTILKYANSIRTFEWVQKGFEVLCPFHLLVHNYFEQVRNLLTMLKYANLYEKNSFVTKVKKYLNVFNLYWTWSKKLKLSKFILKLLLFKIWQNILITIWSCLKVASISSNSK